MEGRLSSLRYTRRDSDNDRGDISGWLVKEGKTLKQPKPRFLRLQGDQLSNHKDPNGSPTWKVSVADCGIGPGPRKNELLVHLPKRRVSFFAESSADFERWIYALKRATASNICLESFYELGEVIGDGINGEVLKGWDKATKEPVAIKSIPYDGDLLKETDVDAEKEIAIVKSLQHPHLVKTYDVFRDLKKQKIYIVMEYVAGGELFARVANERGSLIREGDAIRVARNLLTGVIYLHERNIVHRDIKLENVLCMDADEQKPVQVKLADFGLSSKLSGKDCLCRSHVGTSFYIAPEIIKRKDYGESVDLWAIGVLLYITLSGQFPFCGKDEDEYYESVVNDEVEFPDEDWKNISTEAKNFIQGLLEKKVEKRLNAHEALSHSWINDSDIEDFVVNEESDEDEFAAPKSIFGGKKKTPAEILAKVKSVHR